MENEDDEGFQEYTVTSRDPGAAFLVATLLFCVFMAALLPCLVMVGRRCQRARQENNIVGETDSSAHSFSVKEEDEEKSASSSHSEGISSVASAVVKAILDAGGPLKRNPARVAQKEKAIEDEFAAADNNDALEEKTSTSSKGSAHSNAPKAPPDPPEQVPKEESSVTEQQPASVDPRKTTCGCFASSFDTLLEIAEIDYETRRICKLGIPFVGQALVEGASDIIQVALIGKFIGTPALSAILIVDLAAGLTIDFAAGLQDSLTTLCSQAVGAGNNKLTGQYVQISAILFTLCCIPIFTFWMFFMGPTIRWFGFDEETVKIGQDYILLYLFDAFLESIDDCTHSLLDVIDKASYSTWFILAQEIVETTVTAVIATQTDVTDLQLLGIAWVACGAFFLILNISIVMWNGWFDKFLDGMVGSFALSVRS